MLQTAWGISGLCIGSLGVAVAGGLDGDRVAVVFDLLQGSRGGGNSTIFDQVTQSHLDTATKFRTFAILSLLPYARK